MNHKKSIFIMTENKSIMIFESTYWKIQRYLSILLIPLVFWFLMIILSFLMNPISNEITFLQFIELITFGDKKYIFVLFSFIVFSHMGLGLIEVIEDYIHNEQVKLMINILLKILIIRLMNEIYIFYIG